MEKIGERIVELRAARGMTQEDLAAAAGISVSVGRKLEYESTGGPPAWRATTRSRGRSE